MTKEAKREIDAEKLAWHEREEIFDILVFGKSDAVIVAEIEALVEKRVKAALAARPQEQASQPPQRLRNEKGEIVGASQEAEIPKWAYDLAFQRGAEAMADKAAQLVLSLDDGGLDFMALTAEDIANKVRSLAGSSVLGAATTTSTQPPCTEAELEDFEYDTEPCVCDHYRREHHYRTDHCTYPGCGCTKFDLLHEVMARRRSDEPPNR